MTARDKWRSIQAIIGTKQDGIPGTKDGTALKVLLDDATAEYHESKAAKVSGARDISEKGVKLIQHFESLSLNAYKDSVGVWTIGWGHTGLQHKDGTVYAGRTITKEKALELFRYDMEQFEARVSSFVKVPLNDDEYAALVSFDFNTGGLGRSTLLKKLNAGDRAGAAKEFPKWSKAGGVTLRGLQRRRYSEQRLFLGKDPYILSLDQMDKVIKGQAV